MLIDQIVKNIGLLTRLYRNFSHQQQKKEFFQIKDELPVKTPAVYPKQYPTNLSDTAPLVPRGRPVRFLTPKDEIPEIKMMSNEDVVIRTIYKDRWRSPENAYKLNVGTKPLIKVSSAPSTQANRNFSPN
jgi:hypothetical protein